MSPPTGRVPGEGGTGAKMFLTYLAWLSPVVRARRILWIGSWSTKNRCADRPKAMPRHRPSSPGKSKPSSNLARITFILSGFIPNLE